MFTHAFSSSTETRLATVRCGWRGPSACVSVRPRVPNNRRRMSTIFASSERFMRASVTEVMLLKAHVEILSGSPLFARLSGWPVHCQGAGSLRRLGGEEKKGYAETRRRPVTTSDLPVTVTRPLLVSSLCLAGPCGCVRGQVNAFSSHKKIGLIDPGS